MCFIKRSGAFKVLFNGAGSLSIIHPGIWGRLTWPSLC